MIPTLLVRCSAWRSAFSKLWDLLKLESPDLYEHPNLLTVVKLGTTLPKIRIGNLKIVKMVNTDSKLRLQGDVGAEFLCIKCRKNLKPRKFLSFLCGNLVATTKNEPEIWKNINSRNFINWDSIMCVSTCKVTAINNIFVGYWVLFPHVFQSTIHNKWSLQFVPSIIKYPKTNLVYVFLSLFLSFLVFNILLSSACIYYVTSHEQVTRNDTLGRMCEEVMGFSPGAVSALTWRDWDKNRKPQSAWLTSKNVAGMLALMWYLMRVLAHML